jgi:hypothetical protein
MSGKTFNRSHAVGVISAAILVGTEILAAALALGWAVGGLMDLGREITWGLIALCLAGGVYLIAIFVKNAKKAEPFYD